MINKKTILVLGAGASMDYGFPSGEQLLQDIINILNGPLLHEDKDAVRMLIAAVTCRYFETKKINKTNICSQYNSVKEFEQKFIRSSTTSIDDFISKIPEDKQELKIIGKILIILSISRLENEQRLIYEHETLEPSHRYYKELGIEKTDPPITIVSLVRGWYNYLWRKIYEGEDIPRNLKALTIITFNYDRSIEQYLYTSLLGMAQRPEPEAREVLNENLFVHHVYGKLGKLPWQDGINAINNYEPFQCAELLDKIAQFRQKNPSVELAYTNIKRWSPYINLIDKICSIVDEIRTYTESKIETAALEDVKNRLSLCDDLFFLGFGYHPENLKWFEPKNLASNRLVDLAGTTYGIGKQDVINIKSRLIKLFLGQELPSINNNIRPNYSNLTIKGFFEEVKPIG